MGNLLNLTLPGKRMGLIRDFCRSQIIWLQERSDMWPCIYGQRPSSNLIVFDCWAENCGVHLSTVVTGVVQHKVSASYVESVLQTSTLCPGEQELEEPEHP